MKLIYFPLDQIRPVGGPAGYLYNLKSGLDTVGSAEVEFLPPRGRSFADSGMVRRLVPEWMKESRRLRRLLELPDRKVAVPDSVADYDTIHFHSTEDLYLCRDFLRTYSGRVLLTSHSPCVYHQELISRLSPTFIGRNVEGLKRLEILDSYAFERADIVVMPCREAEEPYYHSWPRYSAIRQESKLRYVPTGIMPARAVEDRERVRSKYGIPESAFVFCFAGRHNVIKGYDFLLEVAPALLHNSDVWFLIAGRERPLKGINHPRWVEVGWTPDPYSLISASDVFVLPNRETYFDLVMLEALSLGAYVVASRTGGNKYFERFGSAGIVLFDGSQTLQEVLTRVLATTHRERASAGEENARLFREEFTNACFADRYLSLLDSI